MSLLSPAVIAAVSMVAGVGMAVAGVYVLVGTGWALLAGSAPVLVFSGLLLRGLKRAG